MEDEIDKSRRLEERLGLVTGSSMTGSSPTLHEVGTQILR